jgi:hypothetical protein
MFVSGMVYRLDGLNVNVAGFMVCECFVGNYSLKWWVMIFGTMSLWWENCFWNRKNCDGGDINLIGDTIGLDIMCNKMLLVSVKFVDIIGCMN